MAGGGAGAGESGRRCLGQGVQLVRRQNGFLLIGLDFRNGFVWQLGAEALEALKLLDGAAVIALALGLIAEEQDPDVGAARHALEAEGEDVIAVLLAGDVGVVRELVGHEGHRLIVGGESFVEGVGEQAGFEAGHAEQSQLSDGDALDGEQLLGVDRLVVVDEVGFEAREFLDVFEADDGKRGGGEAVLVGIARGARLPLRRARAGGALRVSPVGRELLGRDGLVGIGQW